MASSTSPYPAAASVGLHRSCALNKGARRAQGGKLGPVTKPAILVGINPQGPGWLLLDSTTLREIPSSDVVFQEQVPFYGRHPEREEDQPLDWSAFGESGEPPKPIEQRRQRQHQQHQQEEHQEQQGHQPEQQSGHHEEDQLQQPQGGTGMTQSSSRSNLLSP